MNLDDCLSRQPGEKPQQIFATQADAARGRREPVAGDMDEDRAAAAGNAGPRIVVDLDNEVVEPVDALEPIARFTGRAPERLVITAISRPLAPGIFGPDPSHRQGGAWPWQAIGAPPQPNRTKAACRRGPVAFALIGLDTGPAKRNRNDGPPSRQPPLRRPARPGGNVQYPKRSPRHG